MHTVTIRNLALGEGCPKICVPVFGKNKDEILSSAKAALSSPADFIEWRTDWYEKGTQPEAVCEMLGILRGLFDCPILVTFRTKPEGGAQSITPDQYLSLNLAVCQSRLADLIDIEYFLEADVRDSLLSAAKSHNVRTILSSHDFVKTPAKKEIIKRLTLMEDAGGDIAKIAVMPKNDNDVLILLSASLERKQAAQKPLITMSMGKKGAVSRLIGQFSGSCVTFGSAGAASAPGQPSAEDLRRILDLVGKNM